MLISLGVPGNPLSQLPLPYQMVVHNNMGKQVMCKMNVERRLLYTKLTPWIHLNTGHIANLNDGTIDYRLINTISSAKFIQ